jgi:long-chain fatty acid transport protein
MKTTFIRSASALLLIAAAQQGWATNGYFTHGVGTNSKAMAGAGDAMPEMAIDVANNPASGILVEPSVDLGIAVFSPRRSYSASQSQLNGNFGAFSLDAGTIDSDSEYFPIPYVASNWHFSETVAFTLAFYGRGGMNTDFRSGSATFDPDGPGPAPIMSLPGVFGGGTTGVNLNQAFLELTFSAKLTDNLAVGIAPVIAYQMFEAEGVMAFSPYTKTYVQGFFNGAPVMPENLTNNGTDNSLGFGLKAGLIWNVSDRLALQAAYQTETDMDEFDEYSDLFAEAGSFDIPATARIGASFQTTPNLSLHVDVEHTYYSKVASVANPLSNIAGCPTAGQGGMNPDACLGGSEGFGFGWDDVTVYQFGMKWTPDSLDGITLRAGFNYGEQPISGENAVINILAPAVVEQHFTVGADFDLSNGHRISTAFMYAPEKEVTGTNFFDPTQEVTLRMDQWEFEFAYTF